MENGLFKETNKGVPQGSGLSPLFANIYLNEFDKWCQERWQVSPHQKRVRRRNGQGNYRLLRYADDFIVLSNGGMAQAHKVKQEIKSFLWETLRIELSEEKTRITHINNGFVFLGFHIQRVKNHENRWVIHLRPSPESKRRIKRRLKELTSRKWFWMDEYTRLNTMNSVVRGWCEYYKHTTLSKDIEEIVTFAHFRYQCWLYNKHKRKLSKKYLYRNKTATYLNRNRWYATLKIDDKVKTVYQWQSTRAEYQRSVYIHRAESKIGHPYIDETYEEYAQWEGEAPIKDVRIYPDRGAPFSIVERKAKAKMRDNYTCQECGQQPRDMEAHHVRGKKDNRTEALITLCRTCHLKITELRLMESRTR